MNTEKKRIDFTLESIQLPQEGAVYETFNIGGHSIIVYYGFYDESDREMGGLVPIVPDFLSNPLYTEDGYPLATQTQDSCLHYKVRSQEEGDGWCADCIHYSDENSLIGICKCRKRKLPTI